MFEKLKDYILERHIRNLLKQYYAQFGLTIKEVERMPMKELLEKLNNFLADNKKEITYYANVVSNLEDKVAFLTIDNKEVREQYKRANAENKALHGELARVREDNYKYKLENNIIKQRFGSNELTKDKTTKLEIVK